MPLFWHNLFYFLSKNSMIPAVAYNSKKVCSYRPITLPLPKAKAGGVNFSVLWDSFITILFLKSIEKLNLYSRSNYTLGITTSKMLWCPPPYIKNFQFLKNFQIFEFFPKFWKSSKMLMETQVFLLDGCAHFEACSTCCLIIVYILKGFFVNVKITHMRRQT